MNVLPFILIVHFANSLFPSEYFESHTWPGEYGGADRDVLAQWLFDHCNASCSKENTEYEGYDGWYNNLARPDSGAIDRPLLRRWPAAYRDGSYEPSGSDRPNPMELSENLLKLDQIGTKSNGGKSAFLVFFGQQLVEEILDAQRPACPPEYFNIKIPEDHRLRLETGHSMLPLLRTRYDMRTGYSPNNPRQQLNEITPYFDGGLFYGTSKAWADYLRTNEDGELAPDGLLAATNEKISGLFPAFNRERLPMANPPPPVNHSSFIQQHETLKVERFFKLGNPRGNENTFLLTFGVLWFRWHNYLARNLKDLNPDWDGERIFNEARKWVVATHQHIVVNTWLPIWLGESLGSYEGYDPSIDPQIDQFFQAVAMRFGHTLVVPGVYLRDYGREGCGIEFPTWPNKAVRTCNAYWRPQDAILTKVSDEGDVMDIDRLLMGMASQPCEKEDHKIVEDLRGNVFGPLEFSRRDLMAINIQRARDHGLPDYNTARKAFGLAPVRFDDIDTHFSEVSPEIRDEFRRIHNLSGDRMDVIDPWVGGILETTKNGPGELFRTIIKDQFRRIRDGDRFWFENRANGHFTDDEIRRIKVLTIYDVVMAVTKLDHNDIPKNPFRTFVSKAEMHGNCHSVINETTSDGRLLSYFHLPPLTAERLEESCTTAGTYDYFSNSEASYIITFSFLAAFIIGTGAVVYRLTKVHQQNNLKRSDMSNEKIRETFTNRLKTTVPYLAKERIGTKHPYVPVVIILDPAEKQIQVNNLKGKLIRVLDFSAVSKEIQIFMASDKLHLLIRKKNEYDLFLLFDSEYLRSSFFEGLGSFCDRLKISKEVCDSMLKHLLRRAFTKSDRQKQLEKFFRVIFAQAFKIKHSQKELAEIDSKSEPIINIEITVTEFADALAMKNDSEFVRRIFTLIDKDNNGFISFREFLDLFFLFLKGSAKDKAQLLFNMYDINKTGHLNEESLRNMIRSFMDTCQNVVEQKEFEKTISDIMKSLSNEGSLSFDDFYKAFEMDIERLDEVNIGFTNSPHHSYLKRARDTIDSLYLNDEDLKRRIKGEAVQMDAGAVEAQRIDREQEQEIRRDKKHTNRFYRISRTIEKNLREIFWLVFFTLVTIGIFAERAYHYSVEREHSGLRRIAGYGVTITRGAASGQMFTYSMLLLTMCRNLISNLRETFLNYYIPFDRSVEMHKYIACWALLFTTIHVIGHAVNFYSISTQTADDLTCLFRNYFHATHELPKFHYWCWQTMTGLTGVIVTILTIVIYVCAFPGVSKNLFWFGHKLYPVFYLFAFLHGTGRLVQKPYFIYFFCGPLLLFTIDTIISACRKKVQITVVSAELLPSDVTKLEIKRPNNFEYKSGQWIRIACPRINSSEFHPFTISSSPNEENLTVHIRAVGPWTHEIRNIYDPNMGSSGPLAKLHLDGPYGEGHQDWNRYEVSILIGGGIGVTPFASILKDIVFRTNKAQRTSCQKVYFLWVTKTQKQFEWLVDIIRHVELTDMNKIVSTHLFITQFYQKFDLRTTLLYLCERHFQRISAGRSLFTGLKAVTHFGRPKFPQLFKTIRSLHPEVSNFGVFSCGPPPMTTNVDQACLQINKNLSDGTFHHHYKNF